MSSFLETKGNLAARQFSEKQFWNRHLVYDHRTGKLLITWALKIRLLYFV